MLIKCYDDVPALNLNPGWLEVDAGKTALARYQAIEAAAQPRLKLLARLVGKVLRAPCVSISMVPESSVVLMAGVGVPFRRNVPEESSFTKWCLRAGQTSSIADITQHPDFALHTLVKLAPHVRSWVSTIITSGNSSALGVINVWDTSPRDFTAEEIGLLESYAKLASIELELLQTASQTRGREALLQDIFDNAAVGISVFNKKGERIAVNRYFHQLLKYELDEIIALPFGVLSHPDNADETRAKRRRLLDRDYDSYQQEFRLMAKDGTPIWVRESCARMTTSADSETYAVSIYENINDRRNTEIARDILLGEINHRVKNTLAIVQGIAKQLLRGALTPDEFGAAFESRIQALAQSHDLLTETSWKPIAFSQMVDSLFGCQWANYHQQIHLDLPEIELNAQTAIMLNLLLNELVTNAVKHGALQNATGRVEITGKRREDAGLTWVDLTWHEHANRKITRGSRVGLGLYLIDRAPRLGLGGKGKFEFQDEGVLCEVSFPVYQTQKPFDCSAAPGH